jgi:hypothetical protein
LAEDAWLCHSLKISHKKVDTTFLFIASVGGHKQDFLGRIVVGGAHPTQFHCPQRDRQMRKFTRQETTVAVDRFLLFWYIVLLFLLALDGMSQGY